MEPCDLAILQEAYTNNSFSHYVNSPGSDVKERCRAKFGTLPEEQDEIKTTTTFTKGRVATENEFCIKRKVTREYLSSTSAHHRDMTRIFKNALVIHNGSIYKNNENPYLCRGQVYNRESLKGSWVQCLKGVVVFPTANIIFRVILPLLSPLLLPFKGTDFVKQELKKIPVGLRSAVASTAVSVVGLIPQLSNYARVLNSQMEEAIDSPIPLLKDRVTYAKSIGTVDKSDLDKVNGKLRLILQKEMASSFHNRTKIDLVKQLNQSYEPEEIWNLDKEPKPFAFKHPCKLCDSASATPPKSILKKPKEILEDFGSTTSGLSDYHSVGEGDDFSPNSNFSTYYLAQSRPTSPLDLEENIESPFVEQENLDEVVVDNSQPKTAGFDIIDDEDIAESKEADTTKTSLVMYLAEHMRGADPECTKELIDEVYNFLQKNAIIKLASGLSLKSSLEKIVKKHDAYNMLQESAMFYIVSSKDNFTKCVSIVNDPYFHILYGIRGAETAPWVARVIKRLQNEYKQGNLKTPEQLDALRTELLVGAGTESYL